MKLVLNIAVLRLGCKRLLILDFRLDLLSSNGAFHEINELHVLSLHFRVDLRLDLKLHILLGTELRFET